jgi:hypothetical protein
MKSLIYGLVADGLSDRCLMPIVEWVLGQSIAFQRHSPQLRIAGEFIDPSEFRPPAKTTEARVAMALKHCRCDILFVHRDAEKESLESRTAEIRAAASQHASSLVPIVPVRMTEAWLLFDEQAIRRASDNPNGTVPLNLPNLSKVEFLPDPKTVLREAMEAASEKHGRRLKRFRSEFGRRRQRIVEYIDDFSPLRKLSAFESFVHEARHTLDDFLRPNLT